MTTRLTATVRAHGQDWPVGTVVTVVKKCGVAGYHVAVNGARMWVRDSEIGLRQERSDAGKPAQRRAA